jgi:glyoxylase-like metal-dependent hydrolase (beta-lactamase superfamily II)
VSLIHVLDTLHLGRAGIIAATLVETREGLVLFDTGPESTFDNLVGALKKRDFAPNEIRNVFLSHIHFDHAGAAWRFAELGANIYVHPRGAPHLADPRKLVMSAARIFGDDMERLWGRIAPVPVARLRVLEDGVMTQVGEVSVRALATPGHASHHHVYSWEDNLFGGDVAGVRIGQGPPIPPFVPPELDIEAWLQSIDKMRGLAATKLYLPHFGMIAGSIESHLEALEQCVRRWADWLRQRISAGEDKEQLTPAFASFEAAELRRGGATEEEITGYEAADPSYMAVMAALRCWDPRE